MEINKSIFRFFSKCIVAGSLLILVCNPGAASESVKDALKLCAGIIIPSLLPFFFISGFISSIGFASDLAKFLEKPFKKLPSSVSYACTPFLLGVLGGYPIGAAALSGLVIERKLSSEEAAKLLPFCNNTGPAFIIGAVGGGIFSSSRAGLILYVCHITAAILIALITIPSLHKTKDMLVSSELEYPGIIKVLPSCIKLAMDKCISICGFVIFFSVLTKLLSQLGLISSITLGINRIGIMEIGMCQSFIAGMMELGGGIASMEGMLLSPESLALSAFILGFGSLSVHCQTYALVSEANIKCARHFVGRIFHGAISALLAYCLASLIKI